MGKKTKVGRDSHYIAVEPEPFLLPEFILLYAHFHRGNNQVISWGK